MLDVQDKLSDSTIYPRVLVLMAARNGAAYIEEQIESILAQQQVVVKICVSDDASRDQTFQLLLQMAEIEPCISLSRRDSPSGSAAGNFRHLIDLADSHSFDYVAFADQDDIWYKEKLARACEMLVDKRYAAYSSAVDVGSAGCTVLKQAVSLKSADFLFEGAGQGCTFVMQVDFFRRIQIFVRQHGSELAKFHFHDWMVYILSRTWNCSWYFDSKPSMWYRQHGGNEIGPRRGWKSVKKRLDMILSGWYAQQVRQAATVYDLAGGNDPAATRVAQLLKSRPGVRRNIALSWSTLFDSRRRMSDRLIVSATALTGYL